MRRYEYGDPAKVLERRGEDCTGCIHLGEWRLGAERMVTCDNRDVHGSVRDMAPSRRCDQWKHKGAQID